MYAQFSVFFPLINIICLNHLIFKPDLLIQMVYFNNMPLNVVYSRKRDCNGPTLLLNLCTAVTRSCTCMSAPQTELLCAPNETLLLMLTFQPTRENTERRRERWVHRERKSGKWENKTIIAKRAGTQEKMRQDCMPAPKFFRYYRNSYSDTHVNTEQSRPKCPTHIGVIVTLVF